MNAEPDSEDVADIDELEAELLDDVGDLVADRGGDDAHAREPSMDMALDERAREARGRRTGPARLLVVGGGKGGVGKTLLAANLGIFLATIGRRVVVVDADPGGANLHTFLGVAPALRMPSYRPSLVPGLVPAPLPASAAVDDRPSSPPLGAIGMVFESAVPGLTLVDAGLADASPTHLARRGRLLDLLTAVDADYVVLDIGSGVRPTLLEAFRLADLSLYATLPEPPAIENAYRFVRAWFAHEVRAAAAARDPKLSAELAQLFRVVGRAPAPLDLLRECEARKSPLTELVRDKTRAIELRFVVNQTRLRADLDVGDAMRSAGYRRLGVELDYLGYVDYDDTVWSCIRARRPLLVESPGTKASKNIEKIARRLLSLESGASRRRPSRNVPPESYHDLLEVDRGATDEEIRRAYKRAKEIYAPDSLACYALFDEPGLDALRSRLDEAYDVLLDPSRRRPYELSVFPPSREVSLHSDEPEPADEPRPPAPPISPETEFTGPLLRAVRESRGVELREIAQKTRIGVGYLRAIEEERFAELPAPVYVRGFVTEVAKQLGLDAGQVARTYVRRYARYVEERDKA